jgi:hypothetical protein
MNMEKHCRSEKRKEDSAVFRELALSASRGSNARTSVDCRKRRLFLRHLSFFRWEANIFACGQRLGRASVYKLLIRSAQSRFRVLRKKLFMSRPQ